MRSNNDSQSRPRFAQQVDAIRRNAAARRDVELLKHLNRSIRFEAVCLDGIDATIGEASETTEIELCERGAVRDAERINAAVGETNATADVEMLESRKRQRDHRQANAAVSSTCSIGMQLELGAYPDDH
jgi:hypothetical protein